MPKKLNGRIDLAKIPRKLIYESQGNNQYVYIDIVPNKNGIDQYGRTHAVTVFDKESGKPIYIGNLTTKEFGSKTSNAPAAPVYQAPGAPAPATVPVQAPIAPPVPVWDAKTNQWVIPSAPAPAPVAPATPTPQGEDDLPF